MNPFKIQSIANNRLCILLFCTALQFGALHFGLRSAVGNHDDPGRFEGVRKCMGVEFKIVVYASKRETAVNAINSAFERIEQIESRLSDYRPSSEANQLCAKSPHESFQSVSDDLWTVTHKSIQLSEQTNGAFDITVGPLTRLWRYARSRKKLPTQQQIAKAMSSVGYQHFELNQSHKQIRLVKPDMRLDFGGIGKGYAADEALKTISEFGIKSALVDASGDVVVSDAPPGKNAWTISIKNLTQERTVSTIELCNRAIATSGDAYQFLEIDGKRYSHIVDPTTGIGLTMQSQVTVIAHSGATADSLASAISVMGIERGIEFANKKAGVEAQILYLEKGANLLKQAKTNKFPNKNPQ